MEGFSLVDIYDTKGVEYIFVIGYLLLFILFWMLLCSLRLTSSETNPPRKSTYDMLLEAACLA